MSQILVVTDGEEPLAVPSSLKRVSFEHYLQDFPKRGETKTRLVNLCDTDRYLSRGYYCSLLAEARGHHVLPSVITINDLRDLKLRYSDKAMLDAALAQNGAHHAVEQTMLVLFGWTEAPGMHKLARDIFNKYPAPILRCHWVVRHKLLEVRVERTSVEQLDANQQNQLLEQLDRYTRSQWRSPARKKRLRWDMAILVNPQESHPPSNSEALKRFVTAAAKNGIDARLIRTDEARPVSEFDALFIRETTAIDHPSYHMARAAEREGLVVIDSPSSILRCCNKVFLHDAFSYKGVPALNTRVVMSTSDAALDELETHLDYPMVLKLPEGSFSKGVYKVTDRPELAGRLNELLSTSALALAQEYCYTDFDWRIGFLNGRPLYACKYFMARDHWQIYNHGAKKRQTSGGFETLATFETPRAVLMAAQKAVAMIGDGLYGVDLKQSGSNVYVIEVNDNPSIEAGVEDQYLGKELYMQVMAEFASRLEKRGR